MAGVHWSPGLVTQQYGEETQSWHQRTLGSPQGAQFIEVPRGALSGL
jgi:hypothetical protein